VTGNEETVVITHLRFSSGQDKVAPLTWAQRNMWAPMKWFGKEANQFNLVRTLVLPAPVKQDRVLAVLRCFIERYQTCRTHFVEHGNEAQQKLSALGVYEINVADDRASPKEASEDLMAAMREDAFDHEAEWPLRIGYVIDRKRQVTAIALVGSHMAFDYWAIGRFISLLRGQLANEEGTVSEPVVTLGDPAGLQPLEQAVHQASAVGNLQSESGLRYWERGLYVAPASMFDMPRARVGDFPVERYLLDSAAVTAAATLLAERTRTSVATVVLCLTVLVLTAYSGHDTCALKLIAGNRFDRRHRNLIAHNTLDAFLTVTIDDTDLLTAIRQLHSASLVAYSRAECDPLAVHELIKEMGRRRGIPFDLSTYFNAVPSVSQRQTTIGDMGSTQLGELRRTSRLSSLEPLTKSDMKFYLTAFRLSSGASRLRLLADTAYLPAPLGETILRGIEKVLCDAVSHEIGTREVASRIGITPVHRGPKWINTISGWVDLEAVRQLVQQAAAGAKVAVFAREDLGPGETQMVTAYVASQTISPRALHETVLGLLHGRTGVAAPSEYVICETIPPDGATRIQSS
jgi:Condensation domain